MGQKSQCDVDGTPRIFPSSGFLAVKHQGGVGTNHLERDQSLQLLVLVVYLRELADFYVCLLNPIQNFKLQF